MRSATRKCMLAKGTSNTDLTIWMLNAGKCFPCTPLTASALALCMYLQCKSEWELEMQTIKALQKRWNLNQLTIRRNHYHYYCCFGAETLFFIISIIFPDIRIPGSEDGPKYYSCFEKFKSRISSFLGNRWAADPSDNAFGGKWFLLIQNAWRNKFPFIW